MSEKLERKGVNFEDSEIVIGLVGAIGTELRQVVEILETRFGNVGYRVEIVKISKDVICELEPQLSSNNKGDHCQRIANLMDAGNRARKEDASMMALGAIKKINEMRSDPTRPETRRVVIIDSLKHPAEVAKLRSIYHHGFYLIGVHSGKDRRLNFLKKDLMIDASKANELIDRDKEESTKSGQQVTKTFHLSDFFVRIDGNIDRLKNSLVRIVDILFGDPYKTPTFDEYAMFMAFAASLRSADLSRQVGAVITKDNAIIATGANDCPAFGGGLYWPTVDDKTGEICDIENGRDCAEGRGYDSNKKEQTEIIDEVLKQARESIGTEIDDLKLKAEFDSEDFLCKLDERLRTVLEKSRIKDLTEFGRVVHAEMEALLSCSRANISTKNATLYCTTFPCHNCAKHVVAAGIKRVLYIEPYQKSKAEDFHPDSISLGFEKVDDKVNFEPFVGVGPRRFFDLFSMKLGSGYDLVRNESGEKVNWASSKYKLRLQLIPASYVELEIMAAKVFETYRENVDLKRTDVK